VQIDAPALKTAGFGDQEIAAGIKVMKGAGCRECNGTGYRGRIALYEVMPFTDRLKEMVLQGCSTAELKDEMIRQGIQSLRMAGLGKVRAGTTTIDEVLRVTAADRT